MLSAQYRIIKASGESQQRAARKEATEQHKTNFLLPADGFLAGYSHFTANLLNFHVLRVRERIDESGKYSSRGVDIDFMIWSSRADTGAANDNEIDSVCETLWHQLLLFDLNPFQIYPPENPFGSNERCMSNNNLCENGNTISGTNESSKKKRTEINL